MSNAEAEKLRCALIGLGRIAWRFDAGRAPDEPAQTHWRAYHRNPRCELISGFSPEEKDRADFEKAAQTPAVASLDELLRTEPDVVSVCSPTELHAEQVLHCLEHGVRMIWLEKPPATNLADLDRIIETARRHDATVLVNYMRRYSRLYAVLKDLLSGSELGAPLDIAVHYSRGLELNGSHFIDLVLWLLDDPESFAVEVERGTGQEPSPTFTLRIPDRPVARFVGHAADYHINDVIVTFSHGRATVLSGGLEVRVERRVENKLFPGFYRLGEIPPDFLGTPGRDQCFDEALADLIAAGDEGRAARSNLETARGTQRVIEAVRRDAG
ncbi:MAG: Gfo/Idh/MocA family oxidoreductase [Phycisphaerae bacterium]|nr:Gfo/Idh/MocA family oxidoreductase [Phycisphaerae bacterium]